MFYSVLIPNSLLRQAAHLARWRLRPTVCKDSANERNGKEKTLVFSFAFPSAALSYRKIVQTSGMGKKNGSLENVCGRSFEGLLRTSCSCAPSGHFSCGRTHHPRSALLSSPDRGYPCFSPPQGLPLLHASHSRSALCVAGNACRKGGDYSQSLGESLCRNMKNIFAGSP